MVSLLLIVKNNQYLLLKRSNSEVNYGGFYGLPGGSVEENETPVDALMREIREEMGMLIPNFKILKKYTHNDSFINVYYFNSSEFNENDIILNNEHNHFKFFTYYEIIQNKNSIIPSTITFINDYLSN